MDYLYMSVRQAEFDENTRLRKVFRKHLNLVAEALKDIEWVDSCDKGPGDEEKAILEVLNFKSESAMIDILREESDNLAKLVSRLDARLDD